MSRTLLPITAALAAALLGASTTKAAEVRAPQPNKPVDVARFYTGVWHEIGRRPMSLTDGCVAGATQYSFAGPNKVDVRDTCRKGSPVGAEKAVGGPGKILDPGVNAKLHVSYRLFGLVPLGRDYWVLDHDDDYRWFISADPAFQNLWIYTRDARVTPAERQRLVDRAKALGYDVAKLEFPAQPVDAGAR